MKTSRYTEAQILAILRQAEGGMPVAEPCRAHGMSSASFYKWRAKYGGMDASLISQMKAIEDENRRLKRMYADLSMQADLPLGRPSVITRVLGFDSRRFRVWQARRVRCHQIAQALVALLPGSCCRAMSAA